MSLVKLDEVKDAKSIINLMASTTNPRFSALKIYGSTLNPCYMPSDIGFLLDIKNVDSVTKNFTSREIIFASIIGHDKPVKLLTEHGLYRLLFINNTSVGEVFREFVYMVLDKLKEQRVAHLDNIQEEMKKKFNEELVKASEYLTTKLQNLELEVSANASTIKRNAQLAHKKSQDAAELLYINQQLETKISILESRLLRVESQDKYDEIDADRKYMKYLESKYMKVKIYIYLMPSKDDIDYDYDYKNYSISNPPDDSDVMYYRISKNENCTKGVIVKILYFETEACFTKFKTALEENIDQITSDTYLCDLIAINELYITYRSNSLNSHICSD